MNTLVTCEECETTYDLAVEEQAAEYFYGHDCEVEE